jgi:hypothetical protein
VPSLEPAAKSGFIRGLMADLGVDQRGLPRSLRPLSPEDIAQLAKAGVRVENHGCSGRTLSGAARGPAWAGHREVQGTIELTKGKEYPVKVEYIHQDGKASVHLYWSTRDFKRRVLRLCRE